MDAPRIQYAKTKDGVNIAFWRVGSGVPLVIVPPPFYSHIGFEWEIPEVRSFYERLAEKCQVVRFDVRGSGLSDREIGRTGQEGYLHDLSAVVARLDGEPAVIVSGVDLFKVAVKFASTSPDSTLGLVGWYPALAPHETASLFLALRSVRDTDWKAWSELFAASSAPLAHPIIPKMARLVELSSSPALVNAYRPLQELDVTTLANDVRHPVWAVHLDWARADGERSAWLNEFHERTRRVAASFPNGRFVVSTAEYGWIWTDSFRSVLEAFLDEVAPFSTQSPLAAVGHTGAFRTILFTDIEGHTVMMRRLGDTKGREVLREHERACRDALRAHGGTEVKTIGDSFMASFPSAQKAVECVILASRTKEKAAGGQIFVTDVVRQLVSGKGFSFADRGEMEMKGFEEPVRLYEVRWREAVP